MPRDDWKIKSISEPDLKQVLVIDKDLFPMDSWPEESFHKCIEREQCYALWEADCLIGYMVFSMVADEGELLHVGVDRKHMKKGAASFMMEFMFKKGQNSGIANWYLEVRQSNVAAYNLYKKLGFEVVGKRKDYYKTMGGHEDALLMRKHCAF